MSDERTISEETARAIWRRAAHLQAEAERRMDERAKQVAVDKVAKSDAPHEGGFLLGEVEVAAVEAGISAEFVRIAVAEVGGVGDLPPLPSWEDAAATLLLGKARHSIELTRVIPGSLDASSSAVLRAFSGHPCLLRPREVVELPSNGGRVIVFEVPKYDWSATANPPFVEKAYMSGFWVMHVALRPLPDDDSSTEVVVVGDLYAGRRKRWRWGAATSAVTGAFGSALGVGVGAATAVTGALLVLPGLAGFGVVGGLTAGLWGLTYRHYCGTVESMIEDTLSHLEASSRTLSRFDSLGSRMDGPSRSALPKSEAPSS